MHSFQKAFAGSRRYDMPRCPIEQAQAHAFFHGPDRLAERSGRNSKLGGRSCKAAILGNRRKLQ
jgi:hypothetical protein